MKKKTPAKAPKAITLQDARFKVLKESVLRDIVGGKTEHRTCDTVTPP